MHLFYFFFFYFFFRSNFPFLVITVLFSLYFYYLEYFVVLFPSFLILRRILRLIFSSQKNSPCLLTICACGAPPFQLMQVL